MEQELTALYQELFLNTFFAHLILPVQGTLVLNAMLGFGGYSSAHLFVASMLAGGLAQLVNFTIGRVFIKTLLLDKTVKATWLTRRKAIKITSLVLSGFCVFSFLIPVGSFVTILAGFFRAKLVQVMLAVIVGQAIFYAIKIF